MLDRPHPNHAVGEATKQSQLPSQQDHRLLFHHGHDDGHHRRDENAHRRDAHEDDLHGRSVYLRRCPRANEAKIAPTQTVVSAGGKECELAKCSH